MKNRIFSLVLALLLSINMAVEAFAREVPDLNADDCSIEITVQYKGTPIKDGKLKAVRVGEIYEVDQNYYFRTLVTHERIENPGSQDTVQDMKSFYEKEKSNIPFNIESEVQIQNGKAVFENLVTGLYLIMQTTSSTGYSPMNPFLVSVPYWDGSTYRYHVTAQVKSELKPDIEPPKPTEKPTTPSGTKLPQTGQLTWPIPVMTLTGMALFALGWWLCFGNRKYTYEA